MALAPGSTSTLADVGSDTLDRGRNIARLFRGKPWRVPVASRCGFEQHFCIVVLGIVEDLIGWPELNHNPSLHHGDIVGNLGRNPQVVRDEYDRHLVFFLQIVHQEQHLFLYRQVKRRHAFICDHDIGFRREGARHADTLTLSAGKTARVAAVGRFAKADLLLKLDRACFGVPAAIPLKVQATRDHVTHGL